MLLTVAVGGILSLETFLFPFKVLTYYFEANLSPPLVSLAV